MLQIDKTKGYSLAFLSENRPFWHSSLRAYNLCLNGSILKLKYSCSSSLKDLLNDVFRFKFQDKSKSFKIRQLCIFMCYNTSLF